MSNQNQSQSQSQSTVIPSLDGWRALAILMVFLSHAGLGHIVPGGLGVTIFFFLSGYLITTLTVREFERSTTVSIKNFYARRALRLLPPLMITLVLAYALTYMGLLSGGVSFLGFISQLLYFANYYGLFFDLGGTTPAGTGVFWSLAVEEHFYFVFPIIFLLFFSLKNRWKLIAPLVVIAVFALLWRFYLVVFLNVHESRVFYATDTRIDSIVYGCLLALMFNPTECATMNRISFGKLDGLIIGMGVGGLLFSILYRNPIFRETLRYSLQGLALAPIFFYSIRYHQHFIFRPLQWKIAQRLGVYSYSIYLVHYILLDRLHDATSWSVVNGVLAMGGAVIYAVAIDRFVDKPARDIKRLFY